MATTAYRITRVAAGWRAIADTEEREFTDRDEAIRWCQARAVRGDIAAAPEEGAYAENDIAIEDEDDL